MEQIYQKERLWLYNILGRYSSQVARTFISEARCNAFKHSNLFIERKSLKAWEDVCIGHLLEVFQVYDYTPITLDYAPNLLARTPS